MASFFYVGSDTLLDNNARRCDTLVNQNLIDPQPSFHTSADSVQGRIQGGGGLDKEVVSQKKRRKKGNMVKMLLIIQIWTIFIQQ